ncbi:hypothetical protein QGN29_02960 [Temperatibacter marinus]|uniref:Lipopolysaccharide assembly protein A domain-containing protein n=1 Tax=Temperatibacter marinus TaxID=1456591 RepID=A0AA52EJB4_9PROT|nr:hypothetical protein [Temperatibacter marinus]WND03329.1 hypothetical protein QGN29_02960 [Temperatibacter marinus]
MIKFLYRLFWVLFAALLVTVSLFNRDSVFIAVPFTDLSIESAVYIVFFSGIFTGVLLTGMALSWTRLKSFTTRRKAEREADLLKTRLKVQEEEETVQSAEKSYKAVSEAAKE